MFTDFFYLLRQRGLNVSLNEWLTLIEGMEKGLHGSTLTGFYQLCKAILMKSEADYDRFDQIFMEFFKDVPYQNDLPDNVLNWLEHPSENLQRDLEELKQFGFHDEELNDLLERLFKKLKEQTEEHNGGNYWVGTQGLTPWGNNGWHPEGILIGGEGQHRTAMMSAEKRKFRDFRKDNTLDIRQFQMAFRILRQLSSHTDNSEKVFDVDETIRATCDNAGRLKVRYRNPRKNSIKLLLLMDSGGSMEHYASLCSMLFQAATKSNYFKEVKIYYFHNCIYSDLYEEPTLPWDAPTSTEWVLKNYDSSYKVIVVGDASMDIQELKSARYDWNTKTYGPSGLDWLKQLKKTYPYLIWLNPEPMPAQSNYWTQTHIFLAQMFPMYDLSIEGLEVGMKRLMARRNQTT